MYKASKTIKGNTKNLTPGIAMPWHTAQKDPYSRTLRILTLTFNAHAYENIGYHMDKNLKRDTYIEQTRYLTRLVRVMDHDT